MPEFYVTFARKKINKIPEFYMICARKNNKMPEFYMIFARKIFFPIFWGVGGQVPPAPVSYAYGGRQERRLTFTVRYSKIKRGPALAAFQCFP